MRNAFVFSLVTLAEKDSRINLLVGDLGYSVVEPFADKFPDRFCNVGVAEQNMVGVAAGLAACGKIVFIYSLANFPTLRCLEQIRNDLCYHEANVKIVSIGSGVTYGTHGITHHATEDLAILRSLPKLQILAPGDPLESAWATRMAVEHPGPFYLSLGKAGEPIIHNQTIDFQFGKGQIVRDGTDATLLTIGGTLSLAVAVADVLATDGIKLRVVSMLSLKPFDDKIVLQAARETGIILTLEEQYYPGGLGSATAEVIAGAAGIKCLFRQLDLRHVPWGEVGTQKYLRNMAGLSVAGISHNIKELVRASQA